MEKKPHETMLQRLSRQPALAASVILVQLEYRRKEDWIKTRAGPN